VQSSRFFHCARLDPVGRGPRPFSHLVELRKELLAGVSDFAAELPRAPCLLGPERLE
jgi:hypothetical protein